VSALRATLVVLLAVAACTGGSDEPPGASSTTAPKPVEGRTVRLGIGGALVIDPTKASLASPSDLMVLDLLHDGLTRLDGDGVAQAGLATSWAVNDARTEFRFALDPEATFTSGRPVTAQDVVASLERVMAGGDSSLGALSLEAVSGFQAFASGEAEHVTGLSAPDGQTVVVALDTPLSVLPEVLADPVLSVVDAETAAADDLGSLDLTGDWAVASVGADTLRLEPRDGTPGDLEAIELRTFEDGEAAYDAFDTGDVDWASIPASRYDQAVEAYGDAAFAPFHAELFFGLNLGSPSLANPALGHAIVSAIDRDAIVAAVYPDLADALATVVPTGLVGHDPVRCDLCAYDPTGAAAAVKAAFPAGDVPVVRIDFDASTPQQAMAELIADDLEAVGIPTELRPKPRAEYERFVVSGDQELFSFGWIGAYGSPDAFLAPLFGSAANDNLTGFRSAAVDGYLALARGGPDAATMALLWGLAEKEILDAGVVVPIAQFRTQVVVADRVEGLVHAIDGTVDWSQVRVTS